MKIFFIALSCLLVFGCLAFFLPKQANKVVIGVVVPMEHEALTQIVGGLKKELQDRDDVTIKVVNGQGDPNIQKALIQQLQQTGCDLFVPIGTSSAQMTLNLAPSSKVVCLAVDPTIISGAKALQATALDDNVSIKDSLSFLHGAFPDLSKITLVYSASEKVAKEVAYVEKEALSYGIKVQKLMIQTMSDLYSVSQAVDKSSEAILILKDHLVVSGISTLVKQAEKRKIPVMASDEGSIFSGGAFALGVKESSIGELGASMVKKALDGISPRDIMPQTMADSPLLFVNKSSCIKQGIDFESLVQAARQMNIKVESVKGGEDAL